MSRLMKKVLMIDNYDSFTYNLVHYIEEIGPKVTIKRNDTINIKEIIKINPEIIFISPGPCTPKEAGISVLIQSPMREISEIYLLVIRKSP